MLSAMNETGYVLASRVTKDSGPFTCPMCKGGVVVKKGHSKIHHFAHIPPTDCSYAVGESERHRRAKLEIFEALSKHPQVTKLQLERSLGDVRPDSSFYLRGIPIAIEVQISALSLDTIMRRTDAYTRKGVYLLWISPYQPDLKENKKYSPRQWEKYLHTMYFGKVYYWLSGEILQPVKFDSYKLYVEESSWWEGEGSDAHEVSAGGYHRYSKRYRTPVLLDPVSITELERIVRKPYSSHRIGIPGAKLWG